MRIMPAGNVDTEYGECIYLNKSKIISHLTISDTILIIVVVFVIIFSSLLSYRKLTNNDIAVIEIDGDCRSISLAKDTLIDLGNGMTIEVKNGKVRVKESDCQQKICVKHGWIKFDNDVIVCIPNKTIIYVSHRGDMDYITQ